MKKAILFDLDGTLIDSSEGIINSVLHALSTLGIEETDLDKLRHFIGPPLVESFMKYYGFSEELSKSLVPAYREYYRPRGIFECTLYPGAEQCLKTLKEQGYQIGLASSKPEDFCITILKHHHVYDLFDEVTGATQDGRLTTKEDVLEEVLRRWSGYAKEEMCLIGDTIYDVKGANYIGIDCIGVSFGFGDVQEMLDAGAKCICDSLDEVPAAITTLR